MAIRDNLSDLQARLAERVAAARAQPAKTAWLAVECGGHGLLFPLDQAGQIFTLAPLVRVAHAKPWFAGVASLRGELHGVVDLAAFLGLAPTPIAEGVREQARLVAFSARSGLNCALLVGRLAGLRNADQLQALQSDPTTAEDPSGRVRARPPFVGDRYFDRDGRVWQELLLMRLAEAPQFLSIVA